MNFANPLLTVDKMCCLFIFLEMFDSCHPNALSTLQAVIPRFEVFLGSGTAPRLSHFIQDVQTKGGRPLIGHSFLTVNNSEMTVLQTLVTEKQPPLPLTHLR